MAVLVDVLVAVEVGVAVAVGVVVGVRVGVLVGVRVGVTVCVAVGVLVGGAPETPHTWSVGRLPGPASHCSTAPVPLVCLYDPIPPAPGFGAPDRVKVPLPAAVHELPVVE